VELDYAVYYILLGKTKGAEGLVYQAAPNLPELPFPQTHLLPWSDSRHRRQAVYLADRPACWGNLRQMSREKSDK